MMLFSGAMLLAGGGVVALACIDKTAESFGWYRIGSIVKILLPIAAFAAGVYFLETNALLEWLR